MRYAAPGTAGAKISLKPRYGNFIGGQRVAPDSGEYFGNITPITGQTYCEIPRSNAQDIERAGQPSLFVSSFDQSALCRHFTLRGGC